MVVWCMYVNWHTYLVSSYRIHFLEFLTEISFQHYWKNNVYLIYNIYSQTKSWFFDSQLSLVPTTITHIVWSHLSRYIDVTLTNTLTGIYARCTGSMDRQNGIATDWSPLVFVCSFIDLWARNIAEYSPHRDKSRKNVDLCRYRRNMTFASVDFLR